LLLSLCVHAALGGALWYVISTSLPPTPHELHVQVELSPRAVPVPATVSAAPAPVDTTTSTTAPSKIEKAHAERVVHEAVRMASEASPADTAIAVDRNAQASTAAAPSLPAGDSSQVVGDAPAIDLRVLEWLARYRAYPLAARRARLEGVVRLRVTLLPDGRFIDARIERSSGHALLDQAALDLLAHAAPLPAEFASGRSAQIELQLPIVYRMRASST